MTLTLEENKKMDVQSTVQPTTHTAYDDLVPMSDFVNERFRQNKKWPTIPIFRAWINSRNEVALACIHKIGGRYLINVKKFEEFCRNSALGS